MTAVPFSIFCFGVMDKAEGAVDAQYAGLFGQGRVVGGEETGVAGRSKVFGRNGSGPTREWTKLPPMELQ